MSNNKPFLFDSDSLKNFHKRIFFSVLVFCFCFTSAFTKITFISISSHFDEPTKATIKHNLNRGNIYDRNGLILAATTNSKSLYAQANLINNIDILSKKLGKILSIDEVLIKAEEIESNSNQILEFTKEIKNMSEDSKIKIVEVLWSIIYSDSNADMYENSLMRRLTGLLYLDTKIVGDIKKKIINNL